MASKNYVVDRRLELFPIRAAIHTEHESLQIGGVGLGKLAAEYGTPLYLYDQATIQDAIQQYRQALDREYPATSGLTYAGKAFLCLAIARWMSAQGLKIDCSSRSELHIIQQAGVSSDLIVQHGVNKSQQDILAGIQQAGVLVADHLDELIELREQISSGLTTFPEIWLRWRPGLSVQTHSHTQTALAESKFGFSSEEMFKAVRFCLESGLPLTGLHFHLGSNIQDLSPLAAGIQEGVKLLAALRTATGWTAKFMSPGGGLGIAYHENDLPGVSIEAYVHTIADNLLKGCHNYALPLPHLQLEPGRSLVGRAGVALYRVGTLKQAGDRKWILVDGGMADNPRPALYDSQYSALPVEQVWRPAAGSFWLGGPACESGDVLAKDLALPQLSTGELLAIPASGAYQLSMSSHYNGALRPAVLWLDGRQASLIQERENPDDLIRHDLLPA